MATPNKYGNKTGATHNAYNSSVYRDYRDFETLSSRYEKMKTSVGYTPHAHNRVTNQRLTNYSAARSTTRPLYERNRLIASRGYGRSISETPSFHRDIKVSMANYSAQNKLYNIPFMATHYKNSAKDYRVITRQSIESIGYKRKPFEVSPMLSISLEKLTCALNQKVKEAIYSKHVFTMACNCDIIREELEKRNWVEKLVPKRYSELMQLSFNPLVRDQGSNYNTMAITRALREYPANFVWQVTANNEFATQSFPFRNRTHRRDDVDFTTKIGLLGCVKIAQFKQNDGKCIISHPRCFSLSGFSPNNQRFTEEYRQTLCHCVIRYICLNHYNEDLIIDGNLGTMPAHIIDFALARLQFFLQTKGKNKNQAISKRAKEPTLKQWEDFEKKAVNFLHNGEKLKMVTEELDVVVEIGKLLLESLEALNENFRWDGCYNIWIMKPSYKCRGCGIVIKNDLQEILQYAYRNSHQHFIAQKYIERPLLIYKTKFDIRLYMLQTISENNISLWLYDDCYLRFSSREFQLKNFDRSVHLTNNAIQKYCDNQVDRSENLPPHNMWSLKEFKLYLDKEYDEKKIWESKILRSIERNLKAVVESSLIGLRVVKNEFELFGCDFMLDEKLNVILLEINSNPDLSASTEVTARICPNVLKDLTKVVVDRVQKRNAPTGAFRLIHIINYKFYAQPGSTGKPQFQPMPYSVFESPSKNN